MDDLLFDKRVLWLVPEKKGGINSYSNKILPVLEREFKKSGGRGDINAIFPELSKSDAIINCAKEIAEFSPDLIHIQHEFGLFGSKLPWAYKFRKLIRAIRKELPQVKIVATAHSVIEEDYKYTTEGRGIKRIILFFVNLLLLRYLRKIWGEKTWGIIDAVIVHSMLQIKSIKKSQCSQVCEIPHFIPDLTLGREDVKEASTLFPQKMDTKKYLLVFGFFTPEKGQDIVIKAMCSLSGEFELVLVGGVRRKQDKGYWDYCNHLIEQYSLQDRIKMTGFISEEMIVDAYKIADLVIVPFKWTSGSGSLAHALGMGTPVLASDLKLNREIAVRARNAAHFFESNEPEACADQIKWLFAHPERLSAIEKGANEYRKKFSILNIVKKHLVFYEQVIESV